LHTTLQLIHLPDCIMTKYCRPATLFQDVRSAILNDHVLYTSVSLALCKIMT